MNKRFEICICAVLFAASLQTAGGQLKNDTSSSNSSTVYRENFNESVWRDRAVFTTEENRGAKRIENCTERSIDQFPKDLFTIEQRRSGAVLLHGLFGLYCFLLTAYVCNDYLLPSLDCICADMRISADVAGATFLATASCFPELFVNMVGTFLTESDLGVGTVVGGAVFNTFATPACGALSALHAIQLEWRILSRDCIIYVLSVSTLVIVMWDGFITWYESTILLVLLAGYLTLLFSGKTFGRWYRKLTSICRGKTVTPNGSTSEIEGNDTYGMYKPYFHNELIAEYRRSLTKVSASELPTIRTKEALKDTESFSEPDTPFDWPKNCSAASTSWFLFTWPVKFLLFVTIPDSRFRRFRNWYPITFLMCIVWISIMSYLVSWMMTVVGDALGVPDSVMGITFLSAGGNLPELVSIVILSRQGNGDMAMSNTLGANTLDILLCLGLPWTIKTLMTGKDVVIVSEALRYTILSIVVCVVGFYTMTAVCRYRLNKKVGIFCLLMYTIFLIFAILVELNFFFFVNPPVCDT